MISTGDSLHVTVKYNNDETAVSSKIVLEVIENGKEKRIELDDFYSPEHTAPF